MAWGLLGVLLLLLLGNIITSGWGCESAFVSVRNEGTENKRGGGE